MQGIDVYSGDVPCEEHRCWCLDGAVRSILVRGEFNVAYSPAARLRFGSADKGRLEEAVDCGLGWLVGRALAKVERLGHCVWRFGFGPDAEVQSECPWRIVRDGGVVLSSEDHGHQYGLPQPIDAEAECRALLDGAVIYAVEVRVETRDLVLGFGPGTRLEVVPLSSGYESWQVAGPGRSLVVAQGGGNLTVGGPDAE